jgi:hypothetical protein
MARPRAIAPGQSYAVGSLTLGRRAVDLIGVLSKTVEDSPTVFLTRLIVHYRVVAAAVGVVGG